MTIASTPHSGGWALARSRAPARRRHWYWLGVGLGLLFLLPFALTDLVSLHRDLYYGIYIGTVVAFVGAWIGCANDSPRAVLLRNWRAGVGLGAVFVAAMVAIVLSEPATDRPDGLAFGAAVVWRGVLYGLADGLILSAFPILAVFAAFAGTRLLERRPGKIAVGALGLVVSLLFTAVYHLGYPDFRGEKLRKPLVGDVIWSLPTLVTLSPFGAPIAHAGLHVSAVMHTSQTDVFLPPHERRLEAAPLQAMLEVAVTGGNRLAPGATAYVAGPSGSWSGAAGLADVARRAPMPVDARMRLESVSKIWTATLVYQLAEEGKLRLTDTVADWLPNALPYGDEITLAQLLSHTSGLIDNNDVAADPAPFLARVTDPTFKTALARLREQLERNPAIEFSPRIWIRLASFQPLLSRPGSAYHYSNIGFEILGFVAARAGGRSIESLYRERIFDPLGLEATAYDPQGPIAGVHAKGYRLRPLADTTAVHPGVGAEGGVISTARETAEFLVALMRGDLLGPEMLAAMKNGFWSGGAVTGCGGIAYGHSGGGAGFKTDVWVAGDGSRVGVLLLNGRADASSDGRAGARMRRLYCAAGEAD
jgi:D-alanyl-D-alanine carboxypeptidase